MSSAIPPAQGLYDPANEHDSCGVGFIVDLEDRSVDLGPQEGFVVPKGLVHRTRAPERAVILMVENAGIVPTGDEG